ncbi:MAG TPA: hypothetical protein VEC99_12025 [Clostridia bacterium]|nr:hypothetical protein [Clostridia bacterium]
MRFWELVEPSGSDYKHVQVNGKLEHPYRLPAAECDACGSSVAEWNVVLPYACPDSMRKHPLLTDPDAEVPIKAFQKLERELATELRRSGVKKPALAPGAFLQPGFLDVPSVPTSDFLWSALSSGLSTVVVSDRVGSLLQEHCKSTDIALCPVTPRRIGKRSAKSTPKLPKSGEPEDMMKEYKAAKVVSVGPYYELVVLAQSGYPPGTEPGPVCRVCGESLRQAPEYYSLQRRAWDNLTPAVLESVWGGASIFRLVEKGTLLVVDELKKRLEEMRLSNICFREFPISRPSAALNRRPARLPTVRKSQKGGGR